VDAAQVLFAVNSDLASSTLSASVATYLADERSPSAWLNRPNGRAAPTKRSPKHPTLLRYLAPFLHPHPSLLLPLSTNNSQLSFISRLAARCSPLFPPPTHPNRYNRPIQQTSPDPPGKGSPGLGRTHSCPAHSHRDAHLDSAHLPRSSHFSGISVDLWFRTYSLWRKALQGP
jgi:hypothetical protein